MELGVGLLQLVKVLFRLIIVYTISFAFISAVITCPVLTDSTHRLVSVTNNNFGSNATYACDTGYTLNGDTTRTCGSDGVWSGSEPTCTRKFIHSLVFKSTLPL